MRVTKDDLYAVAVLGGGAAGMAAAVSAAPEPPLRPSARFGDGRGGGAPEDAPSVLCLERNGEPGRKLLATGAGRCNFSNAACPESEEVLRFFRALGLLARRDADGRFYPFAGQAAVVRDALRAEMARRGVVLHCNAPVKSLRRAGEGTGRAPDAAADAQAPARPCFEIETEDGALFRAARLVLATGGKAGPQYGALGDGYAFARRFGHGLVSPLPSLVRMVCAEEERSRLGAIAGVRVKCAATLWIGRAPVGRASGEAQFTEDGLSGICIMDLSRCMRMKGVGDCRVVLDLAPTIEERTLRELFAERRAAFLAGVLPAKLAALIEAETRGNARAAARMAKGMAFSVTGTKGWREAQVTSGGVPLSEVDADTMESKLVRGLFFAGELLDYDGPCGGFNLDWAFRTGIKAGRAAAGMTADA
jgi:predicted Rossmann fold flavoprotein